MKISFCILINILLVVSLHSQNQWVIYTTYNSGLPSNMIGSIYIDSNNTKWITTTNGLAKLNGNTWTVYDTTNSGLPQNMCGSVAKDKLNNIWLTTANKGFVKYNGISWIIYNSFNTGMPLNNPGNIAFDGNNTKWIGGYGLFKYNDTNWVWYNDTNSGLPSNSVISVFVKNNIIWAGTETAGVARFDGNNWTVYNHFNSGLPWNWVTMINLDYYNNFWFTTYGGGVAKFKYEQNLWTVYNTENSGLHHNNTYSIYIDNNNVKWIGASGFAIFNDTTWQIISYPFIHDVFNFAKDRYGNMWICSSFGLYVYNPNGVVGIENNSTIISENMLLISNYPNPFNPSTIIKYNIPRYGGSTTGLITLKIYDILGKEITTLVNEKKSPGTYEVTFNGSNLASGIYLVVLKTDSKIKIHKIILQK